jgi:hypothetical protein
MTWPFASHDAFDAEMQSLRGIFERGSALPEQVFKRRPSAFFFMAFDDLWTDEFFDCIRGVAISFGDDTIVLTVLKPDPIEYYSRRLGSLPMLRFSVRDTPDDFIAAVNEGPGGSAADAVVHRADVLVIHSNALRWIVYGDHDIGLAVWFAADEEASEAIQSCSVRGGIHSEPTDVARLLDLLNVGDTRESLLRNYGAGGKKG